MLYYWHFKHFQVLDKHETLVVKSKRWKLHQKLFSFNSLKSTVHVYIKQTSEDFFILTLDQMCTCNVNEVKVIMTHVHFLSALTVAFSFGFVPQYSKIFIIHSVLGLSTKATPPANRIGAHEQSRFYVNNLRWIQKYLTKQVKMRWSLMFNLLGPEL